MERFLAAGGATQEAGHGPWPLVVARACMDASPMDDRLLSAEEASQRLGLKTTTLYNWLSQSDKGSLLIRGRPVTIGYLQGGPRGQGRIKIEIAEVERIKDLMRVQPKSNRKRQTPLKRASYPGINVRLGRPTD